MIKQTPRARRQAPAEMKRDHPLVRSTRQYFKRDAVTDPQGRLEPRARRQCLDLTVTRAHAERALKIFDAIIEACLGEGWRVYKPERSYYERNPETLVVIGKEEVRIALIEKSVRRKPTE